jgi:hypothetical protein
MNMTRILSVALVTGALFLGVASLFSTSDAEAQSALPAVSTNARWVRMTTLTPSNVRTDGGTRTITLADIPAPLTGVTVADVLVHEKTAFVHTNNDGGAQTLVMDIGKSGALERYAKDVSLMQTDGTRTLGSGTTNVKPRNFELAGTNPVITIVSGNVVDQLSRVTAGNADVYFLVENAPPAPR